MFLINRKVLRIKENIAVYQVEKSLYNLYHVLCARNGKAHVKNLEANAARFLTCV